MLGGGSHLDHKNPQMIKRIAKQMFFPHPDHVQPLLKELSEDSKLSQIYISGGGSSKFEVWQQR